MSINGRDFLSLFFLGRFSSNIDINKIAPRIKNAPRKDIYLDSYT
jgi:hypothetical protein